MTWLKASGEWFIKLWTTHLNALSVPPRSPRLTRRPHPEYQLNKWEIGAAHEEIHCGRICL